MTTPTTRDLTTLDLNAHPFTWITFREWRSEPVYMVIDTRVPNGVTEQEPDSFVSHIVRPAALVSAHRSIGDAMDALHDAVAGYFGITVDDYHAEQRRRLIERLMTS